MATAIDEKKIDSRWQAQGPKLLELSIKPEYQAHGHYYP